MIFPNYQLDKTTPIPLYFQLKQIILNEIENGTYPVNSSIPTELEIQNRFNISRSTIRQAISELISDGYLERRGRTGTYVTTPNKNNTTTNIRSFEPFYLQVQKTGKTARTEIIELKIITASEQEANWLEIPLGSKVIYLLRRRFADNVPIVYLTNYIPYSLCSHILDHNFEKESLYETLSQVSETTPYYVNNKISARSATEMDEKMLNISLGSPVLSCHTISRTSNHLLVDYAYSNYNGELCHYDFDVTK